MSYVFLAIFSSFLWSFVNIIDKYIVSKYRPDPWIPVVVLGFVGFVLSCGILFLNGLAVFNLKIILLCLVLGLIYLLGCLFYIKALMLDDVSKLAPLFLLNPLLVLPFSILFFGQSYSSWNILGIVLMVIGSVVVTLNDRFKITINKSILFILLSLLCSPAVYVIMKYVLQYFSFLEVFCFSRIGFFLCMLPILILHHDKSYLFFKSHGLRPYKMMVGNQILNMTGVLISILAVSKGDIAVVSALTSLQSIFIIFICLGLQKFLPQFKVDAISLRVACFRIVAILVILSGMILATAA